MLSKSLKLPLRQRTDFFKKSQKHFSHLFTFYYQKQSQSAKLLVIIPKKNINKASHRNAVKRRIYNILKNKLEFLDKINLVIVLKKNISELSDEELEQELVSQVKKIIKK